MAAEDGDIAHHAQIEDPGLAISASCGEELVTESAEDRGCNGVLMAMEGCEVAGCARIPKSDAVIFTSRYHEAFGRMPIAGFDVPAVVFECGFVGGGCEIPDLEGVIVRGGDEFGIGWREG